MSGLLLLRIKHLFPLNLYLKRSTGFRKPGGSLVSTVNPPLFSEPLFCLTEPTAQRNRNQMTLCLSQSTQRSRRAGVFESNRWEDDSTQTGLYWVRQVPKELSVVLIFRPKNRTNGKYCSTNLAGSSEALHRMVYRAKRARDKDNQMNAFVLVLSLTQKLHFCLILKKRFKQVSFHTKDCSAVLRELTRVDIKYF